MMVFMPEETVVATGGHFDKFLVFLLIILARLLTDQMGSCSIMAGFGKLSTHKIHKQNLSNHQRYNKIQKYCDFVIVIFFQQI